ncbi:MAG: hypothetical protein KGZ42_13810, partial [Melioribacter sp.]|nr:hypothetical protein [Melioribacter sp.]
MNTISAFVNVNDISLAEYYLGQFGKEPLISSIKFISANRELVFDNLIKVDFVNSSETINKISKATESKYILVINKPIKIDLAPYSLERLISIAESTSAGILYSDYYEMGDARKPHPLIDYQTGSLRDDFDFG